MRERAFASVARRTALLLCSASTACAGSGAPTGPARQDGAVPTSAGAQPANLDSPLLTVYVVNEPLRYFAERIGGDHVDVVFPVPRDVDPAYWSPDGDAIAAFQQADLILLNGAGYARWVSRASLPESALVDTSAAFADRLIPLEDAVTHTHGPEGDHEHGGLAFTTWLDPTLAVEQARAVADAFERARPARAQAFGEGFDALAADLDALDRRLQAVADRLGDEPLLFSHPVYQYLTRRYGLNALSLHWEPDRALDLDELARVLDEHPARWMIWEGEPLAATVTALEALGVSSVVYAPCGRRPGAGDWLAVMQTNASALERGPGALRP